MLTSMDQVRRKHVGQTGNPGLYAATVHENAAPVAIGQMPPFDGPRPLTGQMINTLCELRGDTADMRDHQVQGNQGAEIWGVQWMRADEQTDALCLVLHNPRRGNLMSRFAMCRVPRDASPEARQRASAPYAQVLGCQPAAQDETWWIEPADGHNRGWFHTAVAGGRRFEVFHRDDEPGFNWQVREAGATWSGWTGSLASAQARCRDAAAEMTPPPLPW